MREVVAVGNAHGAELPTDYAERRLALTDDVAPDMTSSMHDLHRGTPLDIRGLSDGVVHLGNTVAAATPLNRAISGVFALFQGGVLAAYETRSTESSGAT
ncbi:ketopantoate reductase family protein [Bradyrhizobium sp. AZCC 2230]|uniref:ketopantoate reductase family protein n=1 Tax=Bradyrhizobium sp. AZCC 2230 TaxID=3117021 RepID=UPI003FA58456